MAVPRSVDVKQLRQKMCIQNIHTHIYEFNTKNGYFYTFSNHTVGGITESGFLFLPIFCGLRLGIPIWGFHFLTFQRIALHEWWEYVSMECQHEVNLDYIIKYLLYIMHWTNRQLFSNALNMWNNFGRNISTFENGRSQTDETIPLKRWMNVNANRISVVLWRSWNIIAISYRRAHYERIFRPNGFPFLYRLLQTSKPTWWCKVDKMICFCEWIGPGIDII